MDEIGLTPPKPTRSNPKDHFPFQELVGWEWESMESGVAVLTLALERRHLSPIGLAHGAVAFTLLDTAMGSAVWTTLPEGEICTTIEISIRYLGGMNEGVARCTGRMAARSGRVAHTEGWVEVGGRKVATATGSFLVSRT